MTTTERIRARAIAWGDGLLPPGRVRERAVALAHRRGIAVAPPVHEVPAHLAARQRPFSTRDKEALTAALIADYFGAQESWFGRPEDYLATDAGREDLADLLVHRLERNRTSVIPWLDARRPLLGRRVLEVGAGDGCSTLALAEQGAAVLALDENERYLAVNRERCRLGGASGVEYVAANATKLGGVVQKGDVDTVIFYATLEHMTFPERMQALRAAWEVLPEGGDLVVVETPNRLWFFDDHTAMAPFYHWLPDDVAMAYARRTSRSYFNAAFETNPDPHTLARWGRGVSFHDFVLALDVPAQALPVASCLHEFLDLPRWRRTSRDGRYVHLLHDLAPEVPRGFLFSYLDVVLER